MSQSSPEFELALLEEIKRFSSQEAKGEVVVLNEGQLLRPEARQPQKVSLSTQDQVGAKQSIEYLIGALRDDKGVHAETIVAVLGAVVGQVLFERYRREWETLEPKFSSIFIEDVNQDLLDSTDFMASVHAQRGGSLEVAADVPEEHLPKKGVSLVVASAASQMTTGLQSTGIDPAQVRWILPYALLGILDMTKQVLPTPVGLRLAFRHMVRGAKTPPAHLPKAGWDE